MPWTRKENTFCVPNYLETKSFQTEPAKFCRKFNYNNYSQKSQIYRWAQKCQAIRSVKNLNNKAENPRSGRKLTAKCLDNVDAVGDSVGIFTKTFPRTSSFTCSVGESQSISALVI